MNGRVTDMLKDYGGSMQGVVNMKFFCSLVFGDICNAITALVLKELPFTCCLGG